MDFDWNWLWVPGEIAVACACFYLGRADRERFHALRVFLRQKLCYFSPERYFL